MECTTLTAATSPPRLQDLLGQAGQTLARAGIDNAALDAEVLLGHALGLKREQLIVMADSPLGAAQAQRFQSLIERRLRREPVSYIIGKQEFWSLDFQVTSDVLIPRPETECVVEAALQFAASWPRGDSMRVLDVGTGSGAIAVALAKELPSARIHGADVSPSALVLARRNAMLNGVGEQIDFCCGDLFAALGQSSPLFDLIVSNPPYIRRAEIAGLAPEVSQWEPRAALDGGTDGLEFYRRIAAAASPWLAPEGALVLEIGADMGRQVCALFKQAGCYRDLTVLQDYAGRDRVVTASFA
ncbi:MAG: peptide chain release factor N(5)-glutamine methyltransferase, partial [Deltaproteobacteria bacterium]|nr:peptide chain release factor N(5)-glutamine methyltransferase [Deltaproteobacteria bacterium]